MKERGGGKGRIKYSRRRVIAEVVQNKRANVRGRMVTA